MEAAANAPLGHIAVDFLKKLFSRPTIFSWSDSGRIAMSLWLGSGEQPAPSAGDGVELPLGFNVSDRRRVFAISEADVKPYTVLSMRRLSGASAVAQFLADTPLQLIEAIASNRTKQQVLEKNCSNEGTKKKIAKLMEEHIRKALCKIPISLAFTTYSHIQLCEPCSLNPPEPNAPL